MGRHSGLSKEAGRISLLSGAEGVIMGGENEGSSDEIGKSWQREILFPGKLCVFPVFGTAAWEQKTRCPAADDLFRVSLKKAVNPWRV